MADYPKGYSAVSQNEEAGVYTQPPGYSETYQPLHQPVNNSYGTPQQEQQPNQPFPPYQEPPRAYPPYQQPQQQPAYNPNVQYAGVQPAFNQYAPAPPTMQQQSNTNVVVVNQQPQPQTVVHVAPRVNTYLTLSVVLMLVCFIHGNVAFMLLLIPALICACVADNHRQSGNYDQARSCGQLSLCWNISSIVMYAVIIVVAVVMIILLVTTNVFVDAGTDPYDNSPYDNSYDY